MSRMLEVYSLRWEIEVYFKETKQHLGFLAEQTITFASHTASIHLTAIRYLMLAQPKLVDHGERIGRRPRRTQDQLDAPSFAGRLWDIFRAVITGALSGLKRYLGYSARTVMEVIDRKVNDFLLKVYNWILLH